MDYKKKLKSKKLRLKILKLFDFVPDKFMIKLQYRLSMGKSLNLKMPKRFTEKLQWYKLFYRDSLMTKCSDKYEVRSYVASKGLESILVPMFGVYENENQIDFEKLPYKFVLKTTNGSHTNVFCNDKNTLDIAQVKSFFKDALKIWAGKIGREWAYYNVVPKIICEKYLDKDENNDIVDYKFFCFNGEPSYLYVISDRYNQSGMSLGIFDLSFNQLQYERRDITRLNKSIKKPANFEEMISIAKILSKDFPHVRVDLYNIEGIIYFGELTFYNGSGYKKYYPDDFDFIVGNLFQLPNKLL
jgi:hypothetical protein